MMVESRDLGIVNAIDSTEHEVKIQFEGREVIYDYAILVWWQRIDRAIPDFELEQANIQVFGKKSKAEA